MPYGKGKDKKRRENGASRLSRDSAHSPGTFTLSFIKEKRPAWPGGDWKSTRAGRNLRKLVVRTWNGSVNGAYGPSEPLGEPAHRPRSNLRGDK